MQMYRHGKLINRQLCLLTHNGSWISLKSVAMTYRTKLNTKETDAYGNRNYSFY